MTTTTVSTWQVQKAAGEAHEARVCYELDRRGWTVMPYGQGTWPEEIRKALHGVDSVMRHEPDIICARQGDLRLIDCKTSMRGGGAERYTVSRKAIEAHTLMLATRRLPVYYVFGNLGVLTPAEVLHLCRLDSPWQAGAYVAVDARSPVPFDEVFGTPTDQIFDQIMRSLPKAA